MKSQDMAEVVPLFGESASNDVPEQPTVETHWTLSSTEDEGAYRRLLKILFTPRDAEQDQAA